MTLATKQRNEIRRQMTARDLSVSELARLAEVPRQGLSRFLNTPEDANPTCAWIDKVNAGLRKRRRK